MSHGENDYDWLQVFFPGWRAEDQPRGNRNNGGPDQSHHQIPHPAFADAAQTAHAAHAAYVRFQQSRSPQARAAQINQQGQTSAPYSQGMDQTEFRSQLHHHSQYEQPQQHPQQPQIQVQQPYQQQARQQALRLPQLQPLKQAQAQLPAQLQAREQAREQAQRDAQRQAELQAQQQAEKFAQYQALPDPSSQRNSTPQTTQQNVPEIRPQTPPRARSQSQASSNQPEASRIGSFLEDAALFRTKSPQKDPYTSSSHSTLGPRANTSNVPASTATALAPTKPRAVSHSHPSPEPIASAARPASVSVPPSSSAFASAPVTVPAQLRTSGSPPVTSSTAVATASNRPAINRPDVGSSATSASIKSLAMPPVSYALPQTLKAYAATQAQKAPASSQQSAQTVRSISAPSAPLDNFTPFRPASNPRTTPGASVPGSCQPVAAPSTYTNTSWRNSLSSSQVSSVAGPRRKKGRAPIYPDIVSLENQSAGPGRAGDRWKVPSRTNTPPNGIHSQYQPVLSGLPVLRDPAPAPASASARAPAPSQSWTAPANSAYPASGPTPPLGIRSEPASSRFTPGARAISRALPPSRAYQPQPARIFTSGPVQSRPASTQPPAAKIRKLDDSSRQPVTPPSETLPLGQYVRQSPSRKNITYRSDIVETRKSSDVLIKLEYDPATIARDILIVADKHPTEKGLNHHLHSLRQNFQAVDYSSDLATLRWDLVDPWVNYPPSVEQSASRVNQMPASSVTRLETVSRPLNLPPNFPPNFPSAGPSTPHVAARNVPTAPLARPAESRPAYNTNTGITTTAATTSTCTPNPSLTGSTFNNSGFSGLGTIHSGSLRLGKTGADVTSTGVTKTNIGPSYSAASPALASTSTSTSTTTSPPKSTPKPPPTPPSAVNLNAFGALPFKPPSFYSPLRPTAQPLPYSLPSLPPSSSPPRVHPSLPSSSYESHPSVPAPVSEAVAAAPQSLPKESVKSTPVPSSSSTSTASRPPSKAPQTPSQSSRGKASRQSPLPKGLPEPQVVIPISPHKMAPPKKKPGRPAQKDIQVEVAIDNRPAPQYQVFKCKWTGCEAELHNLEAIHTHILAIHIPHHIVCAWDDCTDQNPRAAADMWEHVREKHMIPLAWQLGDGPSASVTAADGYEEPELPGQGRQNTMTLPADRDSVKIFSRIHGTQTSQQKARLMEEGGRQWKEDAGPDMDISDRPLSTPPRLMASSHTESAYTLSEARVVI